MTGQADAVIIVYSTNHAMHIERIIAHPVAWRCLSLE